MTRTLGYKTPKTVRPSMQRVTTNNMRSVQAFNKAMHVFVKHHQLGERITKLESTIHYPPMAAEQQEAEALMKSQMERINTADIVCWKLRMGAIPYSPEFAALVAARDFWNFLGDLKTGKKKQQRQLESYRKLAGILTALTDLKKLDLATIRSNSKEAVQHYKAFTVRQAEKQDTTGRKDLSMNNNKKRTRIGTNNIPPSKTSRRPKKARVKSRGQHQTSCDKWCFEKGNESCTEE
jgi:hypothetical protein